MGTHNRTLIVFALLAALAVLPSARTQNCSTNNARDCVDGGCNWCQIYTSTSGVRKCEGIGQCSAHADCRDVKFGTMAGFYSAIPPDRNNGQRLSVDVVVDNEDTCDSSNVSDFYSAHDCAHCSFHWCQFAATLDGRLIAEGGQCTHDCSWPNKSTTNVLSSDFVLTYRQAANPEECRALTATTTAQPTTTTAAATTATTTKSATKAAPPPAEQATSTATTTAQPTASTATAAVRPPPRPVTSTAATSAPELPSVTAEKTTTATVTAGQQQSKTSAGTTTAAAATSQTAQHATTVASAAMPASRVTALLSTLAAATVTCLSLVSVF